MFAVVGGKNPPKFYSTFPTTTGMRCLVVKTAWKNVHQHPIGTISVKVHSNILYYVGTRDYFLNR